MVALVSIFFILASIEDIHKCSNEFEFRQYFTMATELSALGRLKNRHIILWPLYRHFFFDWIVFVFVGNKDMHYMYPFDVSATKYGTKVVYCIST